jgi:hypothetical protein
VATKDTTGDGTPDAVVAGGGTATEVRVLRVTPTGFAPTATLVPFGGRGGDGVYVG